MMSHAPCPVCNAERAHNIYRRGEHGLCRCAACGVVFLGRGAEAYALENYDYYKDRLAAPASALYGDLNTRRYRSILDGLRKYHKNNRLLDVGCGIGHFVKTAVEAGWSAEGIEVAGHAVEICRKHGIPAVEADLLGYGEPGAYDVVNLFEVIEHLADPRRYVRRAWELLRSGGCVLITTPNFNSVTRLLIGDRWRAINKEHLVYFTPTTLRGLVEKCGFRVISCDVRNIEPHELIKLFRPGLSENRARDQEIREAIEQSAPLRLAKRVMNMLLNLTKLGETVFLIAEKR